MISLLIAIVFCSGGALAAMSTTITVHSLKIGDSIINMTYEKFPVPSNCASCISDLAFLNLHENENTSVVAARSFLARNGGSLVKFSVGNNRLVSFKIKSSTYSVDPNRIFTPEGIEATLKQYSKYSADAAAETQKLADGVLEIYGFSSQIVVLALHNNGGSYGANSYLPGGSYENDASKVYIEPGSNPSDFFYVVDEYYYDTLSNQGYNIVLQNNQTVTNDGSLSYYAGLMGKAYVNFESQAEHTSWGKQAIIQLDMVYAAADAIVARH